MAAYFIELDSQIFLKITAPTTQVSFNAEQDASFGYNLDINGLIPISKDVGEGGAIYNTGVVVNVNPGDLLRVTGTGGDGNNTYTYTPTDTNHLLCVGNTSLIAQGGIRAYPGSTPLNSLNVKKDGAWKSTKSIYTKVSGTWEQCEKVWIKVGETWRLSYEIPTSDWVNMLENLEDAKDFAVQVVAHN
jgi:hypothetical protein